MIGEYIHASLTALIYNIYILGTVRLQSNVARYNATFIAEASCRGLISSKVNVNTYGVDWRLTEKGLQRLSLAGLI